MTDEDLDLDNLQDMVDGHPNQFHFGVRRSSLILLINEVKRLRKELEETLEVLHDLKEDNQAYAVTIKHYSAYEPIHGIYTSSSLFEVKMWTQKEFDEYHLTFGHNMFAEVYCGEEVILIGERIEDELVWKVPRKSDERYE